MPGAWTSIDYLEILDQLGFTEEVNPDEIEEMAKMALADQDSEESAALLLTYKLGEKLTKGQIQQLSIEMEEDKVCEEYPDISLHHELFNVNQLLYSAYNGVFPNCKVVTSTLRISGSKIERFIMDEDWTKEIVLKAILPALGGHSIFSRLYEKQLASGEKFEEANGILWSAIPDKIEEDEFLVSLFSSEYWLQDLPSNAQFECDLVLSEHLEHEDS